MKDKSIVKSTEQLIRKLGQFPVRNWSTFLGGQKVGKMRADLEDFQAKQGVQKVDRNRTEILHQRFTETSPDFRALSLKTLRQRFGAASVVLEKISQEKCRQRNGKLSVVSNTFLLLPCIAQYMRNVLIQFDIPSSYLYVVVLKKPVS
ncbi:MAG: hypothetical protein H6774_01100 [Pseudomonadales bacterium]|nr:hypothetical protein [Pseudomonadales bacterium]